MKLPIVALASIAIALSTASILVPQATTEERVLVFGRQFTVSDPSSHDHESNYLQRAGLTALNIKRMDANAETLAAMIGHTLGEGNKLESELLQTRFIQLLAFFAYQTSEGYEIERQDVVGMCVMYLQDEIPYLALYEQVAGKIVPLPQYHMKLSGALILDDLRLLHFAFADSAETLPIATEIVLVRNEEIAAELQGKITDDRLRLQLITDSERNAGRFTSTYFMGQSYFSGTDLGIADLVIPREQVFYLRDEVLMDTKKGQEYIRGIYHFGSLHKKSPDLIVKYADLIPRVQRIAETLEHGIGSATVLDQAAAAKINEIIGRHRDISDPQFQEFLDHLEADLEALVGKTKNDLLAYLKQAE